MSIEEQQKKALGMLWKMYNFNKTAIAKDLNVDRLTVQMWFKRGRVSATAAILIEEKTEGKITKEELRPDVSEWFGL